MLCFSRKKMITKLITLVHISSFELAVLKLYTCTSWLPGFVRDPLSPSLCPPPSLSPLSLLFVPAFYPPSLGSPGFAQDNCIPEIFFLNLMPSYFEIFDATPPPSDGVGWVGGNFVYYFSRQNFVYRFSRQFVKFPALLKC